MSDYPLDQLQHDVARCHHVWSAMHAGLPASQDLAMHNLLGSASGVMVFFSNPEAFAEAMTIETGYTVTSEDLSVFIAYKHDIAFEHAIDDTAAMFNIPDDPTNLNTSDEVYEHFFGVSV